MCRSRIPPETLCTLPRPLPLPLPLPLHPPPYPSPPSHPVCLTHGDPRTPSRRGSTSNLRLQSWDLHTHRYTSSSCQPSSFSTGAKSPLTCGPLPFFFFHAFVDQRQPSQLRRPSVGRGPQLTPGIGSMVRDGVCVRSDSLQIRHTAL